MMNSNSVVEVRSSNQIQAAVKKFWKEIFTDERFLDYNEKLGSLQKVVVQWRIQPRVLLIMMFFFPH